MSYQVLARKWRPAQFADVVGQAHVVSALSNALDQDRVHHAFLFTGTRGVGKTTLARIFAKALNCEKGVSSTPCGECSACVAVAEGRFIDLIEVDAASRTKVDDTRELLENVQYAPTQGRYKVYLIDEVHMLSAHSFNALLKTLEEPPEHVKFLLATTDPQKLPMTVLSRCIQFSLNAIEQQDIEKQLSTILLSEAINSEPAALSLLARAADGSLRDALSLLDQAIAYSDRQLTEASIRDMLGLVNGQTIVAILDSLAQGDGLALMNCSTQLIQAAQDLRTALDDLLSYLHALALYQFAPEAIEWKGFAREDIERLAALFTPELLQLYYQITLNGKRDFV
ncbi:MAG: DNA polymerase III subunit gamma/tau, partial [Proteobacteria bacterium]|nr:DNA polymerase III subunit gamma/tau [Pseudomonadota bacterium]